MGEHMTRAFIIGLICFGMTACTATTTQSASGGAMAPLATAAFDYAPSGASRLESRHGYELGDGSQWQAEMAYEERGDAPLVEMSYSGAGVAAFEADLAIAMPYLEGGVRRFHGQTGDGRMVEVELQAGPCTEPGSDEVFTHFATIRVASQLVEGCAFEVSETDRWSNYLMDYMPAIDTCLDEFGAEASHVSVAYPMGGSTGVRVVHHDGVTWECVTREQDTAVNSIRPLDAADAVYGEGDPVFVRGRMPSMGEGCYVYEAVRRRDGSLIGAFGFDACGSATPVS